MRLNNKYCDTDSWAFHIEDKELIRSVLQTPDCKTSDLLKALVMKDEWLQPDPERGEPENYTFLKNLKQAYLEYKKTIKVPIKEQLYVDKLVDWVIALFFQDSAYTERIGGTICFFYYNKDNWKDKTKQERVALLYAFRNWWDAKDERDRTRWMIDAAIRCLIKRYEKTEFWMKSLDFCIGWLLEHESEFKPIKAYEPNQWYPAGRGKVQNEIFGGMG